MWTGWDGEGEEACSASSYGLGLPTRLSMRACLHACELRSGAKGRPAATLSAANSLASNPLALLSTNLCTPPPPRPPRFLFLPCALPSPIHPLAARTRPPTASSTPPLHAPSAVLPAGPTGRGGGAGAGQLEGAGAGGGPLQRCVCVCTFVCTFVSVCLCTFVYVVCIMCACSCVL